VRGGRGIEEVLVTEGGELVVFEEDGLGAGGGREVAKLSARELEKFGRSGRAAETLEDGEDGKEFGRGGGGKIEVDLERNRIAGGGGDEVRRKVKAEHGRKRWAGLRVGREGSGDILRRKKEPAETKPPALHYDRPTNKIQNFQVTEAFTLVPAPGTMMLWLRTAAS
jgi:hypothetical protein